MHQQLKIESYPPLQYVLFASTLMVVASSDLRVSLLLWIGCCKQQLWPLLHYVLPMSPASPGRYDQEMWQGYKRANMVGFQANDKGMSSLLNCEQVKDEESASILCIYIPVVRIVHHLTNFCFSGRCLHKL